jgi:hypothetical protein
MTRELTMSFDRPLLIAAMKRVDLALPADTELDPEVIATILADSVIKALEAELAEELGKPGRGYLNRALAWLRDELNESNGGEDYEAGESIPWPGGDTVQYLTELMTAQGVDPDGKED